MKRTLIALLALLLLAGCPAGESDQQESPTTKAAAEQAANPCAAEDEGAAEEEAANPHGSPHGEGMYTGGEEGSADSDLTNENAEGASGEGARMVVERMVQALVEGDRAGFEACFSPDSPEREEMLAMFDDWQGSGNTIEIAGIAVEAATDKFALVNYEFVITESGSEEPELEAGEMEMMLNDDGNWVIMDMQ